MRIVPRHAATVQVSALRAGDVDLIYLPYRDVEAFVGDSKYNVEIFEGGSVAYLLAFDLGKSPMDNLNPRPVVANAINPDAINKAVYFNKATIAKGGMWPVGAWAYDPTAARSHYDPAKARDYLKAGGKPGGFSLDSITWTSQENIPSAEIVRAQLGQIGIKLNLQVYAVSVATEKFYQGREAPLFLTGWSRYPEPDWIGSLNYKSDGYYNVAKLHDARMDALIEDGASTFDLDKRKAIYRKVDEIVLGEAWFVPLLYGVNYAAAPKRVMGLNSVFGWDAKMSLHRLWIAK